MTLSKTQIQKLIENCSKSLFPLQLIPAVKINVTNRKETWLLTYIDPETPSVAHGLCIPEGHFSFLSNINLDSLFEIDDAFETEFSAETYEVAEWSHGELIYDKKVLLSFSKEVIKPAQLSLF